MARARSPMDDYTRDELLEALRPIASLLSKSEKAQQKLSPGTWQHTMLGDNIKALHISLALMSKDVQGESAFTAEDLKEALGAVASMIDRTEKSQGKFPPGSPQYSLQRNRLKALHIAESLIRAKLEVP